MPVGFGYVQGYNAHAAVNEQQIVLAAEITNTSTDFSHLDPMTTATLAGCSGAGVSELPEAVAADAGYCNEQHMDEVIANKHIPVLIPPDKGSRGTPRRGWVGGRYTWMRRVLATQLGRLIYRKRKQTIEPPFGHTKHNRGVNRFHRPGRTAVRTEWRLLMATHNLTKLHRHHLAAAGPQPGPTAQTPPITTDTMARSKPPSNDPHPPEPFERQPPSVARAMRRPSQTSACRRTARVARPAAWPDQDADAPPPNEVMFRAR
jgi:hypothetical protein